MPQGSPLSPLLYCLSTAKLPEAIKNAAPDAMSNQFADDLTLQTTGDKPEEAAKEMQKALDAVSAWAEQNYVEIAVDKTAAMVISVDPKETAGKSTPYLEMQNAAVPYAKTTQILGVEIDTQLRFTDHASAAKKNLTRRTQILRALTGWDWGLKANDLRQLYKSYIRPGGAYAFEVWGMFLSTAQTEKLETCNNQAARVIVGAPKGSPSVQTCAEAEINSLTQDGEDKAAKLLDKCRKAPEGHPLRELAFKEGKRRLRARGDSGWRTDWRSRAQDRLNKCQPGREIREDINIQREVRRFEEYNKHVPPDHPHRRMTSGKPLLANAKRSRAEEVNLHCLRLNRAPFLQATKARHGRAESATCPHCGVEDETTEHWLLRCPKWKTQRKKIGITDDPKQIQNEPEKVTELASVAAHQSPNH